MEFDGRIDMHCHFGPDFVRPGIRHGVTALQAVTEARDAGYRAIVLKAHDFPSPSLAFALNEVVDGIEVFGGIALDYQVGGLNVLAVKAALNLGAKIVWLPTIASHTDALRGLAKARGYPERGLSVVDERGRLLPVVHDIFELVSDYGAILATGHISRAEHRAVAAQWGGTGRVLVTHAMEKLAGPQLTEADCVELAAAGATIEFTALTCEASLGEQSVPVEAIASAIRAIGPSHVVLGSDLGIRDQWPRPVVGHRAFLGDLAACGVGEADLRVMTCEVPSRLLGLNR